jgi:pyruvate,water dikinase
MTSFLRHTDEFAAGAQLGGKAGALARLAAIKLPIPEWFVVTPEAFFASGGKAGELATLRPDLAVQAVALAREIAPDATYFAVRSSALDEDGAEHSFAGQLDSFLFVPPDRIPEKVAAVWRSGFSERILAYRRERGIEGPPQPPAVLVQRMIAADTAGVAFSADPVSGRRNHALVSAVFGLGSALVSGEADADTFTVDRGGRVLARAIVTKHTAHRAAPGDGEGVVVEPVSAALADQPALTNAKAAEVAALARSTERYFGRPQDIEWARADGRLWLLQSRPITSLASLADPDGDLTLWDNANIAESYSGVTTPLTFSFARGIYEAVYREFARMMGVPIGRSGATPRNIRAKPPSCA